MRTILTGLTLFLCFVVGVHAGYANDERGKTLATSICGSCHIQPEPNVLDKATWVSKVFPLMRKYMGLSPVKDLGPMEHDLRAFYPLHPSITEEDWFDIASWYLKNAPSTLEPASRPPIRPPSKLFAAETINSPASPPMTVFADILANGTRILGSGTNNAVQLMPTSGPELTLQLNGPPSAVHVDGTKAYITDMGILWPHDSAIGKLWMVDLERRPQKPVVVLKGLRRPTHVNVVDLDSDGTKEFVVCEFGNSLGRMGWYQQRPKGGFTYHELVGSPGAIRTHVRDLNGDGKPDIVVLLAQARERILVFINQGQGRFEERELLAFHPAFGSSSVVLHDMNNDGMVDIIVTNGDNGDYEQPPLKPYHGVRIFINQGNWEFKQQTFLAVHGCYGAAPVDFDDDGDIDILTIAYFPDYKSSPAEALLLWEAQADGTFLPNAVPGSLDGRWLVLDAADADGDGDVDVLLGNVSNGPGVVPASLAEQWQSGTVQALLLRNQTKDHTALPRR